MSVKYSPLRQTFFADDLTYSNLPTDLIAISNQQHQDIIKALSTGGSVSVDSSGNLVITQLSNDQLAIQALNAAKGSKLSEINTKAQQAIDSINGTIPIYESNTWAIQLSEAQAWIEDNNANTPILNIISKNRNISIGTLANKVIQKSLSYNKQTANIIGQRSNYITALYSSTTVDQVTSIAVVYNTTLESGN